MSSLASLLGMENLSEVVQGSAVGLIMTLVKGAGLGNQSIVKRKVKSVG